MAPADFGVMLQSNVNRTSNSCAKMNSQKTCKHCGKLLPLKEFYLCSSNKDGYENKCKECRSKQRKTNHKSHCKECGILFSSAKKNQLFCSKECTGKHRRNRALKKCNYCGKNVEVIISKTNKQDIFYCNQNCRTEDLKKLMLGENNPNYNRIQYECDGCRKKIFVKPSKLEKQQYIFCNNDCYKQNIGKFFRGNNNPNYLEEVEATCSVCSKSFKRKPSQLKYKKHYCSRECYMNASIRTESKGKIEVKCDDCGKKFRIWESKRKLVKNIYCSRV